MTRYRYPGLLLCSIVFVIGNALHTADHWRRGWGLPLFGVTPEVLVGGVIVSAGALSVLWLTWKGHPWAPPAATAAGLAGAVMVSAAHLAPPWGVFSNSFLALRPDALAWIVVSIEIAGGIATGVVGLAAWRQRDADMALAHG
ncbi:MAG TPA: hypothetical protein VNV65_04125 [Candidatus Solibacter sp.]|jgi:hypothetical protein|nr:hypothetical protein [Candidatus Solibacter sp.]